MSKGALPTVVFFAAAACAGCFSTIAPDTDDSGSAAGSGTNYAIAEVRGKVQLYRGPGDYVDHVTGVQIKWLTSDGVEIDENNVRSNYKGEVGNYYAFTNDPRVAQVKVAPLKCDYDADDPAPRYTCCWDPVPCSGGCVSPWDTAYRMPVARGIPAYKNLRVSCGTD
jgi:hypothetical protein